VPQCVCILLLKTQFVKKVHFQHTRCEILHDNFFKILIQGCLTPKTPPGNVLPFMIHAKYSSALGSCGWAVLARLQKSWSFVFELKYSKLFKNEKYGNFYALSL